MRLTMFLLAAASITGLPAQSSLPTDTAIHPFFYESAYSISRETGNCFTDIRGTALTTNSEETQRYKATLNIEGMTDILKRADIIITADRCYYLAEFGPIQKDTDPEKLRDGMRFQIKQVAADLYYEEEIKGGSRFTKADDPTESIDVYLASGDGNGMFIRVLFQKITP